MLTTPPPGIGRRQPVRLTLKDFRVWQPPSGRNWAELPLDVILYVFQMLDPVELLTGGAAGTCRSWRRAARDEPALWRHIDMRGYVDICVRSHVITIHNLARAALRLSSGQCEAFWTHAGSDDILLRLSELACSLKSLRLISYRGESIDRFVAAIKKFPLLEEFELSECQYVNDKSVLEALSKSCPRLKHLRHIKWKQSYGGTWHNNDGEALAVAGMCGLRSLELHSVHLTNQGLTTILDNCTHLELLIVRHCSNVTMDESLLAKCARVKIVTLRGDHYAHYEVSQIPYIERCSTCALFFPSIWDFGYDYGCDANGFFPEDHYDYEDYSRYLNGVYVTDLDDDEYDNMLPKCVRRYLKMG